MKYLLIPLILFSVSACEQLREIAPRTTAGFEAGGILGAIDGASGAVLARCKTLDGMTIRVALDGIADHVGGADDLTRARELRQAACQNAARIKEAVGADVATN